jgi:hypothetical protein
MTMNPFAMEGLESRRLLSGAGVTAELLGEAPAAVILASDPAPAVASPTFTASGAFTRPPSTADAGKIFHFEGSGTEGALGAFSLKGRIQATGNVSSGRATGNLTFTFASGATVVFNVKSPVGPGFGALPGKFHYTITSSTYNGALATSGIITLVRSGSQHFTFTFQPT